MKNYELLCAIKTNLDIEGVEAVIQNLSSTIETLGGTVNNTDKIGRKKLAYEVKNFRDGFYVLFNFDLSEEKIIDLKRSIKLNEDVIRDLITVVPVKAAK